MVTHHLVHLNSHLKKIYIVKDIIVQKNIYIYLVLT